MHRQMLSSVSHDLKTPLAAIIGSLEIHERMRSMLTPEKAQTLLETALKEAYRLDGFITNILDMAKLENGMVKVRHETCHVHALLQDCIEKSGHRFKNMRITVEPIIPEIVLETDNALLCRAISLLLDNALKYSPEGRGDIRISALRDDSNVTIVIHDNGPGIPEEKIEEIFSKYTRLGRGDHQNAGTGLGLPIARAIVHLLGGDIHAANHGEGGAVFRLHLPLR